MTDTAREVVTTSSIALFRNTGGRMHRTIVAKGTPLTVVERPAPSWSTATRANGREYLIATRVVRDHTRPAGEQPAEAVAQVEPAAMTGDGYRGAAWPPAGSPAAAQRAAGYRPRVI